MFPGWEQFPEGQIIAYALVFLRFVAFVVAMPLIGTAAVPTPLKVLLSIVLALLVAPSLRFTNAELLSINDQVITLAAREVLVGLFLGFFMRLFFFAVSVAGEITGVSSGLASAQLFNPIMGSQGNVIEQFYLVLATLLFFGLNAHHIFLQGLVESFRILPLAGTSIRTDKFVEIATVFQEILTMGVKMSAPVMISILLANLSMGVMGRAVPQMNVFVTSLQVTFVLTLVVLIVTIPFFLDEMQVLLQEMARQFSSTVKVL